MAGTSRSAKRETVRKQLPTVLLNVAVVLVAIVVYDQVRGRPPGRSKAPSSNERLSDAIEALDARVGMLESGSPEGLPAAAADDRLLERIEDLERQLGMDAPGAAALPPVETVRSTASIGDEPTPEELEEFQRLASAARRQERIKRIGRRVDAAAEEHRIVLTAAQRDKLIGAYEAFEPRRTEIWAETKAKGAEQGEAANWELLIRRTNEVIYREFAERISTFLSASDAELLATTLNTAGR
jgi:hypothetical protein